MKWQLPENQAVRFLAAMGIVALVATVLGVLGWASYSVFMFMVGAWGEDMAVWVTMGTLGFFFFSFMVYDIHLR